METVVKNLLPTIPTDLAIVVGEIVIRVGELERAIITALARITSQSEEQFIKEVGNHKRGETLGRLIERAEKEFGNKYDWFNSTTLNDLKEKRNSIHDALMQEQDGTYVWQSNSAHRPPNSPDRQHREVNYSDLNSLRDEVIKAIIQINSGSLESKRANPTKKQGV